MPHLALIAMTVMLCLSAAAHSAAKPEPPADADMPVAETSVTATLAPTSARRLFVLDTADPAAEAGKTYIIDGGNAALEGMLSQGYYSNFALSPDGALLYSADTYFEKHTRGKRQDFVVVRDARTLEVLDDILLPNGRFLVVSKKYNFEVTPDGRYALSFNLAPRTAVSVVDLKLRRYVGDIDIPGCGLIFAQAPNQFTSLCADGSVLTVTFDDKLQTTTERVKKVFDAQADPVFEHSGWDKPDRMLYLVSYSGTVVPLDLTGAAAKAQPSWPLATPAERKAGWRPGGWQLTHFHAATKRLYVLMHRGHEWTHKSPGTEVWVYDAAAGKRLQKIRLQKPVQSIAVSPDAAPLLYTIADNAAKIVIYDAASGKFRGQITDIGFTPKLLTVLGE